MRALRSKLTYANVISTLCLFLLLGGGAAMAAGQLARNSVSSVMSFSLTPIPLFVLMGEILFHTGLAVKVIDGIERLIKSYRDLRLQEAQEAIAFVSAALSSTSPSTARARSVSTCFSLRASRIGSTSPISSM